MAEDKEMAKAMLDSAIDHAGRAGQGATFIGIAGRFDMNTTTVATVVTDITPAAAKAQIEIAQMIHAVPAQEQTKRAVEHTKQDRQFTVRHAMVCIVVVACAAMIVYRPEAGWPISAVAGVLGGVYGVSLFMERAKEALGKAPPANP